MKYEIRKMSGDVIYVAEIDCGADAPPGVRHGAAVKVAVRDGANLAGAYLAGAYLAGAYLAGADLHGADLARANLHGANLTHAILHGANLTGADFAGADLARANLARANLAGACLTRVNGIIDGGQRSDGFRLVAVRHDDGPRIAAGCRWFKLAEAREHWTESRGGTPLGEETLARLGMLERAARAHGWPMGDEAQEAA